MISWPSWEAGAGASHNQYPGNWDPDTARAGPGGDQTRAREAAGAVRSRRLGHCCQKYHRGQG